MLDRIKRFLPAVYANDELILSIVDSFREFTDEIQARMKYEFNQLSASTADSTGIGEWEKELAITPSDGSSTELRRALVRAKLMRLPTVTPERLTMIANQFTYSKLAKIIQPKQTYLIEIHVLLEDVMSMRDLYHEVYITKPAHLSLNIIAQIILSVKIRHRAECMQIVDARHCVWNLGSIRTARRDGEFNRDGTTRRTGKHPDPNYKDKQTHSAQIDLLVEATLNGIRQVNRRNGTHCRDGSHRRNGTYQAKPISHACTITTIKNGIEVIEYV